MQRRHFPRRTFTARSPLNGRRLPLPSSAYLTLALLAILATTGCTPPPASTPEGAPAEAAAAAGSPAPAHAPPATPAPVDPHAPARFPDFADVVEAAHPAVVNIYTRTRVAVRPAPTPFSFRHPLVPQERTQQSLGSGFVIDPGGLVLTNEHVVRGATEIAVRLLDERWFEAEIVGADPRTDVALLQIRDADALPHLPMGDSDGLRVGSWVIAIGNPLGLTSTVTVGIASAVGRRGVMPPGAELRYQDFIQTDASINPGNSGGPLLNAAGEVIGINTAVLAEGQGIGFAIPINMVKDILPNLQSEGRVARSWLGIFVGDVPRKLREEIGLTTPGGALVTRVVPGGPAAHAGLAPGDVVLSIDGRPIEDSGRLTWYAANLGIGRTVDVVVRRGHATLTLPLTMGALPD